MTTVESLYRDHGGNALRLAYLLTGDRARAEDLVHDGFVKVLGRVRAVRDPQKLGSYLNRTIVNLAKNSYRAASVHRRSLASIVAEASLGTSTMPDLAARDELHYFLLKLPYRQRAALVLRYCEDMPEAEVAHALGTSPKAVRSLVGRGLATLRDSNGAMERIEG
jgi:RNA polymerase sigma factor (sigma-70 family)